MALRDLFLYNYRWKITALLLAIGVWSVIQFAIYRGVTGGRTQVLRSVSVMVVKAPDDSRTFRVDPPQVDVVFQATRVLTADDVEAFVNLTTMPDVNSALKQVLVRAADVSRVRVEPPFVLVELATPLDFPIPNSIRKP
jgi:hypothetical protein